MSIFSKIPGVEVQWAKGLPVSLDRSPPSWTSSIGLGAFNNLHNAIDANTGRPLHRDLRRPQPI
eukprot:983204-Prorocentrum_minimum.AAC.2